MGHIVVQGLVIIAVKFRIERIITSYSQRPILSVYAAPNASSHG